MLLIRSKSQSLLYSSYKCFSSASVSYSQHSSVPNNPRNKVNFIDTPEEYAKARPFDEMPGPSALQLLTNMSLPWGKYYKAGLKELHGKLQKEYGDVVKFPGMFGRAPLVFLYDADQVEKVFRNEGQWPYRSGFEFFQEFRKNSRPEIFQGIGGLLQDQGKEWQDSRTKVNPVMMQPKTVTRYMGIVDTIAGDFVSKVRRLRNEDGEVPANFGNEMNKWALESIAYIALDQRLGLLTETDKNSDGQRLIENVHLFFDLSYQMEVGPSMWKYVKTPGYHKLMKCLNEMTDTIIKFIDKSVAEMAIKQKDENSEESVLQKLLKIDKKLAIVMALDMLMAGVDTTSNTVLTLLHQLAKNPDKQNLLRQEILEKLPEKDSVFTPETMKNLPYLRACIKESQRMEPVVLGTLRKADRNIILGGYQVPEQYQVVMSQFLMCKQEANYPRGQEFIPERFLKTGNLTHLKSQQPFSFLPFGFGPRMCIGKRLADLEIETVVARIVRNFHVEWHHGEMEYGKNTFMNGPAGDLKFRFVDVGQ